MVCRKLINFLMVLCCALAFQLLAASTHADENESPRPAFLFGDFPNIEWGMSFKDAQLAIEKIGAHPVTRGDQMTELAWDGRFNGMSGRSTVLFEGDTGLYEVAVIAYAMDRREEVFKRWVKQFTQKYGSATEESDNSIATSRVWRLKSGFAIELRLLKDPDTPVVDVHWVKG
jgi:hypothetical protein